MKKVFVQHRTIKATALRQNWHRSAHHRCSEATTAGGDTLWFCIDCMYGGFVETLEDPAERLFQA